MPNAMKKTLICIVLVTCLFLTACGTGQPSGQDVTQGQPPATTVDFSQTVSPAGSYQIIDTGSKVRVGIPGYTLEESVTLRVRAVVNQALNTPGGEFSPLRTYQVELGDLHRFKVPLCLMIQCEAGWLANSTDTSTDLAAAYYDSGLKSWVVLPSLVEVSVLKVWTQHLSEICVGKWKPSTDSGLPGLRGPILNEIRSVNLKMVCDGFPVEDVEGDLGFLPGKQLEATANPSNVPKGAFYQWEVNGETLDQGFNKQSTSLKLTDASTAYTVRLVIRMYPEGPVLAETFRTVRTTTSDALVAPRVSVRRPPEIFEVHDMGCDQGFVGEDYTFNAVLSDCPADTPVRWDFGDGEGASGNPVIHCFRNAGRYRITAIADVKSSISDRAVSYSYYLDVISDPNLRIVAPVTGEKIGPNVSTVFEAQIAGVDASNKWQLSSCTVVWDFGDGTVESVRNVSFWNNDYVRMRHGFGAYGTYHVTVTLYDREVVPGFIMGQDSRSVAVEGNLMIQPNALDGKSGETYTFAATGSLAGSNLLYEWSVDGTPVSKSSAAELRFAFSEAGEHVVSVNAIINEKVVGTASAMVSIKADAAPTSDMLKQLHLRRYLQVSLSVRANTKRRDWTREWVQENTVGLGIPAQTGWEDDYKYVQLTWNGTGFAGQHASGTEQHKLAGSVSPDGTMIIGLEYAYTRNETRTESGSVYTYLEESILKLKDIKIVSPSQLFRATIQGSEVQQHVVEFSTRKTVLLQGKIHSEETVTFSDILWDATTRPKLNVSYYTDTP